MAAVSGRPQSPWKRRVPAGEAAGMNRSKQEVSLETRSSYVRGCWEQGWVGQAVGSPVPKGGRTGGFRERRRGGGMNSLGQAMERGADRDRGRKDQGEGF